MIYNRHLANRFVSDYKLPIPITSKKDLFYYYLNLLEEDYEALTKWNKLLAVIEERFDGDPEKFIEYYLEIREKIIVAVQENPSYQEFNTMSMDRFTIKQKINVSSNNVYNCDNLNKIFLSVDLKKANFQALKFADPNIIFNCKTYEEFIKKFTDADYIIDSKYFRSVIFGMMNPKRHITVEKYIINEIRLLLDELFEINPMSKNYPLVSMATDELVYVNPIINIPHLFNNKQSYEEVLEIIKEKIKTRLGFEVHIELYMLDGYELYSKDTLKVHKTFFNKYNLITDTNKLTCVPQTFFPIILKLFNKEEIIENDKYFEYEKFLVKFEEEMGIHLITKGSFNEHYLPNVKKRLICNNKCDNNDYVTFNYSEKDIDNNIEYFKKCYLDNVNANTALEMFYYYLEKKDEHKY